MARSSRPTPVREPPVRATPLRAALLVTLAAGLASAQDDAPQDVLVLEPGVLELKNIQTSPNGPARYSNAYFSPYENLDQRVIAALHQAKPGSTVCMSYYSISFNEYPKVFHELRDKGVTVKLNLYEKDALTDYKRIDDDLIADGFDVQLIPNLRNPNGQGSMHTKFTVVNDELIVTGSANLSASASLANHEHVVVLLNSTLARKYRAEFNEQRRAAAAMRAALSEDEFAYYNSSWQDPFPQDWNEGSPSRASELRATLRQIDRRTRNGSRLVQTWFSPEDDLERRCRDELMKARASVKVAMYTFVNGLVNSLVTLARRGVKVEVICDDHQMDMEFAQWVNDKLNGEENIRYVRAENHLGLYSAIHHKYAVIDDEVVLGGSYNWTGNATRFNDENLIVVHSKPIAERFAADFSSMMKEYDPDGDHVPATVVGDTTRVLFSVALPFDLPRSHLAFVQVKLPGGGEQTVELRHSRSTGENWLGSCDLPRGAAVTWRAGVAKTGSIVGVLSGEEGGESHLEEGDPRALEASADGLAQIVHERWRGPNPLAE